MTLNISKKDRDLLFQLNQNSRQTTAQLAKKIGLSKQSATYRINNLKERGLIFQFYSLINFTALGYHPYKIFLRMNNLSNKEINEYLRLLQNKKYVVWTMHCGGHFDIVVGIISKNSEHFRKIYLEILSENQDKIADSDHSTIISAHQKNKEYLSESKEKSKLNNFYTDKALDTIDEKDSKILKLLAPNSKMPTIDIAKEIGLTTEAVRVRINNLKRKNILMGSSVLININKLNLLGYKILLKLKNKSQDHINELIKYLLNKPKILEIINTLGNWDIEFDIEIGSVEELNNIITEIRTKFKEIILEYEALIKYKEHSYNYYPIP